MRMIITIFALLSSLEIFSQVSYRPAPEPAKNIVRIEYFIDTDPGIGQANSVSINPAQNIQNQQFQVSLDGLAKGIHLLYIRSFDEEGKWSLTSLVLFDNFQLPQYPSSALKPGLSAAEYFIDSDPGIGNGIAIPLSQDTVMQTTFLANLTGLSSGVHQLYVRTKDESGRWSLNNVRLFDNSSIVPYRQAPVPASPVNSIEYYIDNDPGFGMGTPVPFTASNDIVGLNVDIDISGLSEGSHVVYFRSRETPWSLSAYVPLQKGSVLPVSWLYVKAAASDGGGLIQWATGSEFNTEKFIVEFSLDGKQFFTAGEVAAKNNSGGASYTFHHKSSLSGLHYYRIKQVDRDGKFTFSRIVQLLISSEHDQLKLYPNPAREFVYVQIPPGKSLSQVSLLDQQGKVLKVLSGKSLVDRPVSISLRGLSPGAYYIKLFYKDAAIIYPFLKN